MAQRWSFILWGALSRTAVSQPAPEKEQEAQKYNYDFSNTMWRPLDVNYTTIVDPTASSGTWEGWGTSLCWWAHVFGQRDDLADLFFTLQTVSVSGTDLPGLGLNIARYNAGGSSTRRIGNVSMVRSPRMPDFKAMPGFWEDPASEDPDSSSWNWSADANQVAMLQKAVQRGVNFPTLFSNSPMWWMCGDHNPSGSVLGLQDNLQSQYYRQHAVYLATIAARAPAMWGVTFNSVEAFNEPASGFWFAAGTQEGCHFGHDTQATLIGLLRDELDHQGLTGTAVAASDENTYTGALATWNSFDDATRAKVGRLNVHGYEQGQGPRGQLREAAGQRRLWNSEYGDGDASGMSLATNLHLDLRTLRNTAWVYWQVIDGGGWGLVTADLVAGQISGHNPKYFVLAHYTRHIRPGMTIIDGGEPNTVAAYSEADGRLVLVTVNYATEQWITYDLSKLPRVGGPVSRWCTNTQGGETYAEHHDLSVEAGGRFTAHFAPNTVQTFEIGAASQFASAFV